MLGSIHEPRRQGTLGAGQGPRRASHPHVVYGRCWSTSGSTSHAGAITQHKLSGEFGGDCYNGGLSNRDSDPTRLHLVAVPRCTSDQSDGQVRFVLGSIPRDRWFAVKVHERFSNDPSVGFAQAWIDTDGRPNDYVERLPRTEVDNESGNESGARVKFRIGTYSKGPTPRTIYIDGFQMNCIPTAERIGLSVHSGPLPGASP